MSYIDIRGSIGTPEALAAELEKLTNASLWPDGPVADDILTVSLGDEIGVAGSGTDLGFIHFLQAREQKPVDVGCGQPTWSSVLSTCNQTTGACAECGMNTSISVAVNPATQRLYYFSRLYENEEGLLRFKTITSSYYRGAHGIIVAYDVTDRLSFTGVQTWMNEIEKNCPGNVAKILVGNKADLESQRAVSHEEG